MRHRPTVVSRVDGPADVTWTFTRPDDWPAGPWDQEPDKKQWIDPATGLDCLIRRNPLFGNLCGYVGVPVGHPLYGQSYADDDAIMELQVHGGITFADMCSPGEPETGICHDDRCGAEQKPWWLGFDCGHYDDFGPGETDFRKYGIRPYGTYKDWPYVTDEVTFLADQIHRLGVDV